MAPAERSFADRWILLQSAFTCLMSACIDAEDKYVIATHIRDLAIQLAPPSIQDHLPTRKTE